MTRQELGQQLRDKGYFHVSSSPGPSDTQTAFVHFWRGNNGHPLIVTELKSGEFTAFKEVPFKQQKSLFGGA